MKILLVVPRLNIGGAESYVYTLAKGLKEKGIEVIITSGGGYLANSLSRNGFKHYYCPIRLNRYLAGKILSFIINREKIDLVHANSAAASYSVSLACEKAKIPWIMTAHGIFGKKESEKGIHRASRIICVSNFLKKYLISKTGMCLTKFITIYNGIDLSLFNFNAVKNDLRKQHGLSNDEFIVGIIGRMATRNGKGHFDLIHAMANQPKSTPWKVLVVGKGNQKWRIQLEAFLKGVSKRMIFIGHQTDIPSVVSACDVLILPSKIETFGLVLAEAMALGKPALAYEVGGTPEAINTGVNGFLVPLSDASGMLSLVDNLYNNRELCNTLGQNGLQRVQTLFNSNIMVDQTIELYRSVLSNEVENRCS